MYPSDPALVDADPVVRAALDVAGSVSPARPGEQISIGRFLAGHNDYQRDAYAVLAASVSSLGVWISRPLAWSFVATIDTEFWAPGFDYLGFHSPGPDRIRRARVQHLRDRLATHSRRCVARCDGRS